jgi:hypothetical protein
LFFVVGTHGGRDASRLARTDCFDRNYKPDAGTNKPIAQLTIYALALSRLTGIRLFDIKCAWFNENEYCEFFPRKLLSRDRDQRAA